MRLRLHPLSARQRLRIEQEIRDEIGFHLEMRAEQNRAQGMSAERAWSEARRTFGDVASVVDGCFRAQSHDPLRAGLRAVETGVVLALGVGLLAAVMSLVSAVLFRPPASFADKGDRIGIWWENPEDGRWFSGSTVEEFDALASLGDVFELVTLSRYTTVQIDSAGGAPEQTRAMLVSPDFSRLYGVTPVLGRDLPASADPADPAGALLSHDLWQRRFAGRPDIVGRSVAVNGRVHTIVGVMHARLNTYLETGLFLPLETPVRDPGFRTLMMAARLRPGVSHAQARDRAAEALRTLDAQSPPVPSGRQVRLRALENVYSEPVRPRLFTELTLVGMVLLALTIHVVLRHLPGVVPRRPEIRRAVARYLAIALASAAIGLLLAQGTGTRLAATVLGPLARLFDVRLDAGVVALAIGLAGVSGALAGRMLARESVRGRGRCRSADAGGRSRSRRWLVTAELALALVLVVSAASPVTRLAQASAGGPGFDARDLQTVDIGLARYLGPPRVALLDELLAEVRDAPGVESAGFTQAFPMLDREWTQHFRTDRDPSTTYRFRSTVIAPGYARTMGIPLLGGRHLTPKDTAGRGDVVLVNRALADRLGGVEQALGTRLQFAREAVPLRIVGVLGNVEPDASRNAVEPTVYRPHAQCGGATGITLILRHGPGESRAAVAAVERLRHLHPALPIGPAVAAADVLREARGPVRFRAAWLGLLALVALVFATFDLAGLVWDGLDRRLDARRGFTLRRHGRALLLPILGVCVPGVTLAAFVAWRLGHLDLPALPTLQAIDGATVAGIALTLLIVAGTVVAVVGLFARSATGLPVAGDSRS